MERKQVENYVSLMVNLTQKEEFLLKTFEQRFHTIYEHRKRAAEILVIAKGLLNKFDLEKKDNMGRLTIELKKYITYNFEPLILQEKQLMEKSKQLANQEKGYVNNEQTIFAQDYIKLHKELSEGGIKGTDAEKVLRKEIDNIALSIKKEKKRLTVNNYLLDLVEKSLMITTEIKDVVLEELGVLDNFIFKEKYIESKQVFKDHIYKLDKLVKRLSKLLRKEKQVVIDPFNKFLKEKKSIDFELLKSIKERGKITIDMIKDDIRKLAVRPKEVTYYINKLKDNYEYLDPGAKEHIKRYVNRIRRAAEWKRDKEEATVDELTRLQTEKAFIIEIEEKEIPRAERANGIFSIAMIDIDHFKGFNDTYGHDVGDKVLYFLAEVLQKTIRAADIPYRLHGEEFIILFVDTDKIKAKEAAEKVRKALEQESIDFMKNINASQHVPFYKKRKNFTISIGVATYPEDGTDRMALYNKVDAAMYVAKKSGRNSVSAAGEVKKKGITTFVRRFVKI